MTVKIISSRCIKNLLLSRNINLVNKTGTQRFCCTTTITKDKTLSEKSTVDRKDVDQHSKQMKEWWDINGPMAPLHSYNLIRVPFVRDGLVPIDSERNTTEPLKGKKILDVGCGGGILSEPLARLGAKVTGLDASPELIQCAQQHSSINPKLTNNRPNYICSTIEDHALENENVYDGVVASEIIEHVNNKKLFVEACVCTLKPGGRIFFTTPNRTKIAELGVIFLAENILNLVPKGTHQIDKFITPTELTFLLERNNCHVETIYGIFFNIITGKWSWSNYQTIAYAIQACKLNTT